MGKLLNRVRTSAFWLVVPAIAIAALVGSAVAGYEPLVFDPSLYEVQSAEAAELDTIDPAAIEAEHIVEEEVEAPVSAPAASVSGGLADGTWTGYAACGVGNSAGWKPYYVGVTVRVSGGKSQGISRVFGSSTGNAGSTSLSWDASENQSYLDWAESGRAGETGVKAQVNAMAASGNLSGVDTVSKATYSSVAIYNAYLDALEKAASAAGGSIGQKKADVGKKPGKEPEKKDTVTADVEVGTLADGTWTAYEKCGPDPDQTWKPYYVGVTLTVSGGAVSSLDKIFGSSQGEPGAQALSWDADENQQYLDGAVAGVRAQIEKALAAGGQPSSVDAVSGATYSSKAIFQAYYGALSKSAAAAGSSVEVPAVPEVSDGESQDSTDSGAEDEAGDGESRDSADSGTEDEAGFYGFALCEAATSEWNSYYLFVKVKADGGQVSEISQVYGDADGIVEPDVVYSASQNATYLDWAIDGKFGGIGYRMKSVVAQIQETIDAGLEVSGIQTVSGATRSSRAIIAAYQMAAANAAAGEGATPEEAVALTRDEDAESALEAGRVLFVSLG